jgi:hypothetical protein
MDIQELLKPRYRVIADWPGNKYFAVGEILSTHPIYELYAADKLKHLRKCDNSAGVDISNLEKHPHLFRKLEWWEERDEKDMPEYLKFDNGMVVKVDSYLMDVGFNFYYGESAGYGKRPFRGSNVIPATESEYQSYNTQKP